MAVNILESLRHPKVEEWLISVIDRDQAVNVCGTAVDLLGELGSPISHDALERLKLRFSDEPYIQFDPSKRYFVDKRLVKHVSRKQAAETFYDALRPGGFICLGHSESMSRSSSLYKIRRFPEAIVNQKPGDAK